eukprot:RCo009096
MDIGAVVCPAHPKFWETFYATSGPGGTCPMEWFLGWSQCRDVVLPAVQSCVDRRGGGSAAVLHCGCGSSLLAEEMVRDPECPEGVQVLNVDLNPVVIERMAGRRKLSPSLQQRVLYEVGDICAMNFSDESFDLVLDKGAVDAFFSNTGPEQGDNSNVIKYFAEVYRVLRGGGQFLVLSVTSDSELVFPYSCAHDWDFNFESLQVSSQKDSEEYFAAPDDTERDRAADARGAGPPSRSSRSRGRVCR